MLRELRFEYRLLIAGSIFLALFFVEYPPIFLLGYWSWSGLVHKTLTGVLLVINLVLAQYAARKLGLFQAVPNALRA
jgi:hypothetical protein